MKLLYIPAPKYCFSHTYAILVVTSHVHVFMHTIANMLQIQFSPKPECWFSHTFSTDVLKLATGLGTAPHGSERVLHSFTATGTVHIIYSIAKYITVFPFATVAQFTVYISAYLVLDHKNLVSNQKNVIFNHNSVLFNNKNLVLKLQKPGIESQKPVIQP